MPPAPTQTPVNPLIIKDAELLIEDVDADPNAGPDFRKHVSQAQYDPTSSQASWQGMDPDETFSDDSAPTFRCTVGYVQDWDTDGSLSEYLFEHIGQKKRFTFYPRRGTGNKGFQSVVTIGTGALGGTVNQYATATVSMGSTKPTVVTRAADA